MPSPLFAFLIDGNSGLWSNQKPVCSVAGGRSHFVDTTLGNDQQRGDDHHRAADEQQLIPSALVGKNGGGQRGHISDGTAESGSFVSG